jgi:Ankyrin repeats (3 copies)
MYPNPQDVLPLPARPNLEQYKKLAKDLAKACRSGAPEAIRALAARWPEQTVELDAFARRTLTSRDCALTAAQFVIARAHGFESWPKFAAHLNDLGRAASPVSTFEAAAEAVVAGDIATLQRLLREQPALIRARSTREHRATLLHYAAANGVEHYRQQTPPNAVAIAQTLLAAGAEVDADAEMYGGGCTTLGLVATSIHPERAGVQNALMQVLIDHGAAIDHPGAVGNNHSFVVGCLANGRGASAEYVAARGARLDLEGAAGLGRLDLVKSHFTPDGTLKPPATAEQMHAGFAWACQYGRTKVVEFLLDRGIPIDAAVRHDGQTGLHWAALGAHADLVSLLIDRHAPIDVADATYHGTPLSWALHGWSEPPYGTARDRYYDVVARLVRAGAVAEPHWSGGGEASTPFTKMLLADARMLAALRGDH